MPDLKSYGGYWGKCKVYGWVEQAGQRLEEVFPEHRGSYNWQARIIVAAESKSAAARAAGYSRPSAMWNLSETGNVVEAGVALNEPGVVFWRPLSGQGLPYRRKP